MSDKIAYASPCGRGGSMTYDEAVRKSVLRHQRQAANFHDYYVEHRDSGREFLAVFFAELSAESSELARALMRIEGDAA